MLSGCEGSEGKWVRKKTLWEEQEWKDEWRRMKVWLDAAVCVSGDANGDKLKEKPTECASQVSVHQQLTENLHVSRDIPQDTPSHGCCHITPETPNLPKLFHCLVTVKVTSDHFHNIHILYVMYVCMHRAVCDYFTVCVYLSSQLTQACYFVKVCVYWRHHDAHLGGDHVTSLCWG